MFCPPRQNLQPSGNAADRQTRTLRQGRRAPRQRSTHDAPIDGKDIVMSQDKIGRRSLCLLRRFGYNITLSSAEIVKRRNS